jgi:hypothetical protein
VSWDRAEFDELSERRKADTAEERRPELRQVALGAVEAEKLTGSEEWDNFLKILAARVEEVEKQYESVREQMASPSITNHDELMRLKIAVHQCLTEKRVLESVMGLPRRMIVEGQRASSLLKGLRKSA